MLRRYRLAESEPEIATAWRGDSACQKEDPTCKERVTVDTSSSGASSVWRETHPGYETQVVPHRRARAPLHARVRVGRGRGTTEFYAAADGAADRHLLPALRRQRTRVLSEVSYPAFRGEGPAGQDCINANWTVTHAIDAARGRRLRGGEDTRLRGPRKRTQSVSARFGNTQRVLIFVPLSAPPHAPAASLGARDVVSRALRALRGARAVVQLGGGRRHDGPQRRPLQGAARAGGP